MGRGVETDYPCRGKEIQDVFFGLEIVEKRYVEKHDETLAAFGRRYGMNFHRRNEDYITLMKFKYFLADIYGINIPGAEYYLERRVLVVGETRRLVVMPDSVTVPGKIIYVFLVMVYLS